MSLLVPLGLLGLIGIIALIIIYIIKPNYQNKFISSTFIWKLSLKYKRKKIPLNKLRNILLFICQVAIITGAAFILAQPIINQDTSDSSGESIIIIDASASMQTETNFKTRLERAAEKAREDAKNALESGKKVSVILASDESSFLVQQASKDQEDLVYKAFDSIIATPEDVYTFETPDIDGAMALAEQITSYAKNASVALYTDTNYLDVGNVTVHNISDVSEWNAAILDVRAITVENYYRIEIDVASYAADARIDVTCEIFNYNGQNKTEEIISTAYCSNDEVTTLVFGYVTEGMTKEDAEGIDEIVALESFDNIYVHISERDSLAYDNQFYLYGGNKPVLKILYYSSSANNYWSTALLVLQDMLKDKWAIDITEAQSGQLETSGYDIYIFEHTIPKVLPTDGVVIYSDPTSNLPAEAGVRFGHAMSLQISSIEPEDLPKLTKGEEHPLMKNVNPGNIAVTKFIEVISSDGYTPLAYFDKYPLLMVKEDLDQKIVLMPFSLHYSNLSVTPEFPLFLNNIISHFFPLTTEDYIFETGDELTLNSRGQTLEVTGPETELTLNAFPAKHTVTRPGIYTLTQYLMSGDPYIENVYVKIPATESAVNHTEEVLTNPYFFEETNSTIIDLLFYFALAVVALLFIEWWLKSREQI